MVNDPQTIEKCTKVLLSKFQYKGNKELYKVDIDIIKKIIFNCALSQNIIENAGSIKDYDKDDYDGFIVFEDSDGNVTGFQNDEIKKKTNHHQ